VLFRTSLHHYRRPYVEAPPSGHLGATVDTTDLRNAYATFLDVAREGGFGAPPADGWSAEQVAAHIALNDRALIAATLDVLAGEPASLDNRLITTGTVLSRHAFDRGGLKQLIDDIDASSRDLCDLVDQLDDHGARTEVPTRIVDGDEVRVDGPLSWGRVVGGASRYHLEVHAQQLRELRS
jgi:hypothetical protein